VGHTVVCKSAGKYIRGTITSYHPVLKWYKLVPEMSDDDFSNEPIPAIDIDDQDIVEWISSPAYSPWVGQVALEQLPDDVLQHDSTPDPDMISSFEPVRWEQIQNHPDSKLIEEACRKEINELLRLQVGTLMPKAQVPPRFHKQIIPSKWVIQKKFDFTVDPPVFERYRARYVPKGYRQRDVHLLQTYSPTLPLVALRTILAMTTDLTWEAVHADISSAFLHTPLPPDLDIYIQPPPFFFDKETVIKLRKSIYGLQNAARDWHDHLQKILRSMNISPLKTEQCIFQHSSGDLLILLYVDDLAIFSRNRALKDSIIHQLQQHFPLKVKNHLEQFLGIRCKRLSNGGWQLDMQAYTDNLLKKFGMLTSHPVKTPLPSNFVVKVASDESTSAQAITEARSMIGSLIYLALTIRYDIIFSVCYLSQYLLSAPAQVIQGAKHIFRYLVGTREFALTYESKTFQPQLVMYVDSSLANCSETYRSYQGWLIYFNSSLITWKSGRQKTVATSSMEAEIYSLSMATYDVVYLRNLISELQIQPLLPARIYVDNSAVLQFCQGSSHQNRSKHFDLRFHYVKEKVAHQDPSSSNA